MIVDPEPGSIERLTSNFAESDMRLAKQNPSAPKAIIVLRFQLGGLRQARGARYLVWVFSCEAQVRRAAAGLCCKESESTYLTHQPPAGVQTCAG